MRVLVAGADGVIGGALVPLLRAVGHDVIGICRTERRAVALRGAGVEAVVADTLDREAVLRAVDTAAPDAVANLLGAIPAELEPGRLGPNPAVTSRPRTQDNRNLLSAARRAGVRRIVVRGLAYAYEPGPGLADEDTPWWAAPPARFAPNLGALRDVEECAAEAGGLVLRFGHVYGPGSIYAADGSFVRQVRAGRTALVGGGTATYSFTHAQDAAAAVVAALDKNATGALNVVDDEPAPMHVWLPVLAEILGARKPRRIPTALARPVIGDLGVAWTTRLRGADNSRAKTALDWCPGHASWRTGFAAELQVPAVVRGG